MVSFPGFLYVAGDKVKLIKVPTVKKQRQILENLRNGHTVIDWPTDKCAYN